MILNDLVNAKDVFKKMSVMDLPVRISYKIAKLISSIDKELTTFEEERNQLVRKYGKEVNGQTKVADENLKEFGKDYNELITIEVDCEMGLLDLDSISELILSPNEVSLIDKFIKPIEIIK